MRIDPAADRAGPVDAAHPARPKTGPRWRIPAFGATALVVSAAMVGGYPTGAGDGLLTYQSAPGYGSTLDAAVPLPEVGR